ncbi:peptidase [Pseudomonas solani]|uniref:Peptidase n=1 Tax=Pseudomonas solani TaxID=2731552 RepID=A0AAU7YAJ3_9PSED|nr:M15 family metallopeptidase [Pseudomonas solani]BCD89209.1 peptidase [Pseudomonas solani]
MHYSAAALAMLDKLGIPVGLVVAKGLQEFTEATVLEVAEVDANGREHQLAPSAAKAWARLKSGASADGVDLHIVSAFRSVARQVSIIERKLKAGLSLEQILAVSAPPLFSEHHTGLAVDIGTPGCPALETEFENTPAFAWLEKHAAAFGFQLSYPRGNPNGFDYEPWHWRFIPTPG